MNESFLRLMTTTNADFFCSTRSTNKKQKWKAEEASAESSQARKFYNGKKSNSEIKHVFTSALINKHSMNHQYFIDWAILPTHLLREERRNSRLLQ